jgi:hypothetical protein
MMRCALRHAAQSVSIYLNRLEVDVKLAIPICHFFQFRFVNSSVTRPLKVAMRLVKILQPFVQVTFKAFLTDKRSLSQSLRRRILLSVT